mgnify:FL=1|jgi:hypothetical protein
MSPEQEEALAVLKGVMRDYSKRKEVIKLMEVRSHLKELNTIDIEEDILNQSETLCLLIDKSINKHMEKIYKISVSKLADKNNKITH